MMILKQDEKSFHVLDVLGQMGIWKLDFEGLERYLGALEKKRASSSAPVKTFPLLENARTASKRDAVAPFDGKKEQDDDIFEHGLPEACFFDTRIVLDNARLFTRGVITPPSISLDVNAVCNYACRWCCTDVHKDGKKSVLDIQDIEAWVIKPLAQGGNLTWYLVGGEPSLTPERTTAIAEMIGKHTAAYSALAPFIALDSNGTAFTRNAGLYKESGINTIQFSLSSADPQKDRYFRGCPAGTDPVKTVISAIEAAKSHDLHCGINMVLWKEDEKRHNLTDVEEIIGLGTDLEVDFIRITPAVYTAVSATNGMHLEKEDLRQVGQRLKNLNLHTAGNGTTKVVSMLLEQEDAAGQATDRPMLCRGGTCFVHVDHKGDVFPCAMVMPDFRIGNAVRDDLVKLWYTDSALLPWREVTEVCPECAACHDRNFCVGKCPAYAWFKFGDLSLSSRPLACPC